MRELDETTLERLDEEAYIAAAERESPNSPGFDALRERIYEQLCEKEAA